MRPFGTLFVEHAMRVHAVCLCAIVSEYNSDGVTHLRAEDGTEQAQMLPLRRTLFQDRKAGICILAIDRLPVDLANAIFGVLSPELRHVIEGHAAHLVDTQRSVVPVNLVCGDVVSSDLTAVLDREFL